MRYNFDVRLDESAIQRAGLAYMWRRFGWRYVAGWAVVGLCAAVYSLVTKNTLATVLGVLTAALGVILVIFPFVMWHSLRRMTDGYVGLTGGASVHYQVDRIGLTSTCASGSGDLRWSAFRDVQKTEDVWLLTMANEDRFIPLPVDQVPEDALQFIESEIATHAGSA
ncbi:MAG: YcxB family protein [Armatimonadota bacterium]|nr:YcxB family protein [Armatimonadota bacterium]